MQRPILILYNAFRMFMLALVAVSAALAIHIIVWPPDLSQRVGDMTGEEMARQGDEFCDKYGPAPNLTAHALCTTELKRIRDQDRDRIYTTSTW
jgi:hypothetical protein